MKKQIINILKGYTSDINAFLATYSINYIINTVKCNGIVLNNECTMELKELLN